MIKKIIILSILLGTLSACSDNIDIKKNIPNNPQVIEEVQKEVSNLKTVSVDVFKKEIEKKDGILVDLRTPGEIAQGVIEGGAINIDFYSSDFKEKINSLDKNKKYLIYCRSGARSGRALNLMKDLGFTNVLNLSGGIGTWINSGENLGVFGENKEIKNNEEKTITLLEVQKHNKNSDCWTIIDNKVYDITSFFGIHPGGDGKIEILCGVDGTKDFMGKHGENAKAQMKKEEFYIGDLK